MADRRIALACAKHPTHPRAYIVGVMEDDEPAAYTVEVSATGRSVQFFTASCFGPITPRSDFDRWFSDRVTRLAALPLHRDGNPGCDRLRSKLVRDEAKAFHAVSQ